MFENIKRQHNGNYQFSLAKRGKNICPQCKQKTLVLYIDNETGNPIHETVGRCDHENSCAYHYPPKQYFADNNIPFDKKKEYTPSQKPIHKPKPQASYIDKKVLKGYLRDDENNNFTMWLVKLVGVEQASEAIRRYCVETYKHDGTVFWQIDLQGKTRAGKIMFYDVTGHRRKDVMPPVQWVHNILELPDFKLSQCFFGEHLLHDDTKTVTIVESEKTAVIASAYFPNVIWLATGGSNGLRIDKCQCLKERTVVLFPDAGMFDKWSEKAKELSTICNVTISDLVEKNATDQERKAGYDLADYLEKPPFAAQLETLIV